MRRPVLEWEEVEGERWWEGFVVGRVRWSASGPDPGPGPDFSVRAIVAGVDGVEIE